MSARRIVIRNRRFVWQEADGRLTAVRVSDRQLAHLRQTAHLAQAAERKAADNART